MVVLKKNKDEYSQDELFSHGQIRLKQLSVFNWGSFHGLHTASIDPDGTLVTGDNGSGKSTFIDGLMALLLPAGKATFNVAAAQGDRSDRSLISYMRGSFGSAHDGVATRVRCKREKSVVTGLRAMYQADDGSCITLAALFWISGTSNVISEIKRNYILAKRDLKLKEILDAFGEGNVRQLKHWLREDPAITDCDSHFSDYQELYRQYLCMDNKNAPALLSRALGLKKIDDLTGLIRTLVLEPSGVKDDAKKVVEAFADLVTIHDRLVDAKEQFQHLQRLPELAQTISQSKAVLEQLLQEKQSLSLYFAEELAVLWQEKLQELKRELELLAVRLDQIETQESDAQYAVEQRHEEYLNLGGDQIESLKKDIQYAQAKLDQVIKDSSQYQSDCRKLSLDTDLNNVSFQQNLEQAKQESQLLEQKKNQSLESFAQARAELSESRQFFKTIQADITEIEARPNSNIQKEFQLLRDEIIASLELAADDIVFVGELIDVAEQEKPWQGAIERALGGLKLTLLVPQASYSMITRWLNARYTGLHVRVQVVLDRPTESVSFSALGFLSKLIWKDHPYRNWLQKHLNKFDLQCVSSTEMLDQTPFSMTKEGLVHKEKGRFEKKDKSRVDNRRDWQLGFSNKSRLALLHHDKSELEQRLVALQKSDQNALAELQQINDQEKLWERLLGYTWEQIDLAYSQQRLEGFKTDLKKLELAGGDLDLARQGWMLAKQLLLDIQKQKEQLRKDEGALDNKKQDAQNQTSRYQQLASAGISDHVRALLERRIGRITIEQNDQQLKVERQLDHELDRARATKNTSENTANGIMASFKGKDKWQPMTVDWPSGLDGLDHYLDHFKYVEAEGLPQLIDQFQERLNKHATQSLARIRTRLESEREDILERIEIINQVLQRTEFKQNTYLRLGSKREKYNHVQEFDRKIKHALSQATSDDHEGRFAMLSDIIEILDKASSSQTANTLESLRLLDPRYQMSFHAEEIHSETLEVIDVLESSSGKSGGEKEAFAGTIVAASLAYVLTPDGFDKPVYATVFLDEAFSNTAETVSRRVLRVFKELHIHVNLITPYKNLNLARESARSLLIAERNPQLHESHLCEVTWQEIDQRMSQHRKAKMSQFTSEITLHES